MIMQQRRSAPVLWIFCLLFSLAAWLLTACGTVAVTGVENSVDCTGVATPNFTLDVVPVFSSCDSSGCHATVAPAGGLDLVGSGSAATLFNNLISSGAVDPATDPADPLNAPLIAEPFKGLLEHDGGDIYEDFDDLDLITLFCWIEAGAAN